MTIEEAREAAIAESYEVYLERLHFIFDNLTPQLKARFIVYLIRRMELLGYIVTWNESAVQILDGKNEIVIDIIQYFNNFQREVITDDSSKLHLLEILSNLSKISRD